MIETVLQWLTVPRMSAAVCCAVVLRMLYEYLHRKSKRAAAFLLGSGSGVLLLMLLHFLCRGNFAPPLTAGSLGIAGIGGIPGVLLMLLLRGELPLVIC